MFLSSRKLLLVFALLGSTVAQAQDPLEDLLGTGQLPGAAPTGIKVWAELVTSKAEPGETAYLLIHADLPINHYIYALDESFDGHTEITLGEITGLEAIDGSFVPEKPAKVKYEDLFKQDIGKHYDSATWIQRFRITDPVAASISGELTGQYCSSGEGGACTPIRPPATFSVTPTVDEDSAVAQDALFARLSSGARTDGGALPPSPTQAGSTGDPKVTAAEPEMAEDDPRRDGLVAFLVTAVGAGFLALLTPCVFPMVPITVSFFLKQTESGGKPMKLATTYCLGIIGTFTLLGLFMSIFFRAASLNALANNPWLNLFIAAVLIFFGVSLLGMFEIRMPSWLVNWSASKRGQGGMIGTIFMAVTFTLVSFTCTFAFVGGLLAWASKGEYYWATIGMLAFSAAFALPFFFLALFPAMLKKMPKSGGWMNTIKVTMGLVEIGAAFKFLSTADLAWNPSPVLFDYSMVMTAWMVLSLVTGLYLLGAFRLPHDTKSESISVGRFGFAAMFFGFGALLAAGLFGRTEPTGVLWSKVAAFAPPHFESGGAVAAHSAAEPDDTPGPVIWHSGVSYSLDYNAAKEFAAKNNRLMFLDFTGVNCVNCREMERDVMGKGPIPGILKRFVRVQLYTDNVPLIDDRNRVDELLELNRTLQEDWFNDVSLPAYAVVTPDGKTVLSSLKYEPDIKKFQAFLERGLKKWDTAKVAGLDTQQPH